MTPIVYAVPRPPHVQPVNPWPGARMKWVAWDGSSWPMNGHWPRGLSLQAGARGLTMPGGEHTVDESAGVDGGHWRGWHTGVREVFWPLLVWCGGSSQEWLDYDAAFWRTLDWRRPGRWVVTQPNGTSRYLVCRFVSDGGHALAAAPGKREWARYEITLQAEQPFWVGEPVVRPFSVGAPVPLYPESGGYLTVSEGSTVDGATLRNPGDEDTYLTWWIPEQTSGVYGVGDRSVVVPFEVAADRLLVVDTRPTARTAIEIDAPTPGLSQAEQEAWVAARLPTGLDRTRELGAATKFGVLPGGVDSDLTISVVGGGGTVRASFEPLYRRAW